MIRLALERILYLLAQATIDLSDAIVSMKQYRKPGSLSESFQILYENKHISREVLDKMISMTGFRNVIAHDYLKIDYGIVYAILQDGYKDIEAFIEEIKRL